MLQSYIYKINGAKDLSSIATNLQAVYQQIHKAEEKYKRVKNSVAVVAVSKLHGIADVNEAIAAGQLVFGESYVQEALPKIAAIAKVRSDIVWHYIGRIQSNKIKYLANNFSWVQSVTLEEQAEKLSKYRPENLQPLNICIEINLSGEQSKSGVALDNVFSLARNISGLPCLKLRGLMAIPAPALDFATQFSVFKKLEAIWQQCKTQLQNENNDVLLFDTLSMGMSDDFDAAIAVGSTMVRIGTAIFGQRHKK